jgi:hypothetical protein
MAAVQFPILRSKKQRTAAQQCWMLSQLNLCDFIVSIMKHLMVLIIFSVSRQQNSVKSRADSSDLEFRWNLKESRESFVEFWILSLVL